VGAARGLPPIVRGACEILKRFQGWQVSWVPGKWNAMADELVDKAFKGEDVFHAENQLQE
jgi:hypothetical protein